MLRKLRHRIALFSCILATSLSVGCQLPPSPDLAQPRAVVDYGTLDFRKDADLAIVLDYSALLKSGYSVQQTAPLGQLHKIIARVVGKNMPFEQTVEVDCSQVSNGLATLSFTQLPPGPVEIFINAVDDQGKAIAYATGNAVIKPNQTSRVKLTCSTATGDLVIEFDCPGLGGCGATPTPTPVPTPTPSPLYPVNPIALQRLGWVDTMVADNEGGVLLLGMDDNMGPSPWYRPNGRVIRVRSSLTIDPTNVLDDIASQMTGITFGNTAYLFDYWGGRRMLQVELDGAYQSVTETNLQLGALPLGEALDGRLMFAQSGKNAQGEPVFNFYVGDPANPTIHRTAVIPAPGYNPGNLTTDRDNNPVWVGNAADATAGGIFTVDAAGQQVRLATGKYNNIVPVDGAQRTYFVSGAAGYSGNIDYTELRHFDPAQPNVVSPANVYPPLGANDGVRSVVVDDDGFYYLLIQNDAINTAYSTNQFYVKKYRLEFDAQGAPRLVKILDMVDTINPSPSPNP